MKFRTKMIVVFLTVILAPVLMLVLTFWGINRIQIESLRQSYGITDTEGLIASDYFQMFSRLTQSMRDSAAGDSGRGCGLPDGSGLPGHFQ